MAAKIGAIRVRLDLEASSLSAMRCSLGSVADAFLAADGRAERIVDLTAGVSKACADAGDLFCVEVVNETAGRADEISLRAQPSERYEELVAAIGRDLNAPIFVSHGWPILSVVARTTTVTDRGGAGNDASPRGPALCTACDRRTDDRSTRACTRVDCPHRERDAA